MGHALRDLSPEAPLWRFFLGLMQGSCLVLVFASTLRAIAPGHTKQQGRQQVTTFDWRSILEPVVLLNDEEAARMEELSRQRPEMAKLICERMRAAGDKFLKEELAKVAKYFQGASNERK